jgi:predicted nucleic acid-binding protein
MITAVIDTNILVRGAIASHPKSASKQVIDALFAGRFVLYLSVAALREIQRVKCRMFEPTTLVPASFTRDATDTKWVALAIDSKADYLVTADRRHLLRLRQVGNSKVIGPGPFLEIISKSGDPLP